MAGGKGRLNFVLSLEVDKLLSVYCEQTTRNPADVIRQLVSEWLEGDRALIKRATVHPTGRRTNIPLNYGTLAALDKQVRSEGHATVSALVTDLLQSFLAARKSSGEDRITVKVALPTQLFGQLSARAEREGVDLETALIKSLRERMTQYGREKEKV